MISEEDAELIQTIFYMEAPWDYQLVITSQHNPHHKAQCSFTDKACILYNPQTFLGALSTVLHELAHAISGKAHTNEWAAQYMRLLDKYDYPKEELPNNAFMFAQLKEWATNV